MTTPQPMVQCPACRSTELRIEHEEKIARTERGKAAPYWQEFYRCQGCDEEFLSAAQSEASSRAYASALRLAERLVSPDEIFGARQQLGMTQEDFEIALGVGRKTVVRWERGTVVPSRAANGLLWFAVHFPSIFMEYAREHAPEVVRATAEAKLIATIGRAPDEESPPRVMRYVTPSSRGVVQERITTGPSSSVAAGGGEVFTGETV